MVGENRERFNLRLDIGKINRYSCKQDQQLVLVMVLRVSPVGILILSLIHPYPSFAYPSHDYAISFVKNASFFQEFSERDAVADKCETVAPCACQSAAGIIQLAPLAELLGKSKGNDSMNLFRCVLSSGLSVLRSVRRPVTHFFESAKTRLFNHRDH